MFQIDVGTVAYRDPWVASLQERLSGVGRCGTNIAYLYEVPDSSTFRYRVYNMIQTIKAFGEDIWATYFSYDEIDDLSQLLDKFEKIVICRVRYSHKLNQLITAANARSIEVIYDIDDFVFNPDYAHLIVETLDQDMQHPDLWDHWFAYTARMGAALKLCDRAITTNEFLATQLNEYAQIPVSLVPNFMNHEQIDISTKIYDQKEASNFCRDDRFHIGYFSGTPSHNKDYRIIENSLLDLMQRHSDFYLLIVGYLDSGSALNEFSRRITKLPLLDYLNLQREIGKVEVNLVPLQINRFTNCKSNLKYFEAGIAGTLSVASPSYTYEDAITENENGFLASSSQWVEKIETVKGLGTNYREIAERCRRDILDVYTPIKQFGSLMDALKGAGVDCD